MYSNKTIADRIKLRRKMLGKSLQEVATDSNIVKSTLSRYECAAIATPSMPTLRAIATALYVDVSWILGETDEMKAPTTITKSQEVKDILEAAKAQLCQQKGLMFDGKPATDEAITAILDAMEIGLTMAKRKNNQNVAVASLRKEVNK